MIDINIKNIIDYYKQFLIFKEDKIMLSAISKWTESSPEDRIKLCCFISAFDGFYFTCDVTKTHHC